MKNEQERKGRIIPDNKSCMNKVKQCASTWGAQGTEANLGLLKHKDFGKGWLRSWRAE